MVLQDEVIAESEALFKRQPCEAYLLDLARELVFRYESHEEAHQRGVSLFQRAVKQYKSVNADNELAYFYDQFGTEKEKEQVIPLLESCLQKQPSANLCYNIGMRLFRGWCGETDKQRGLGLLQRAVVMDGQNAYYMTELSRAWMQCRPGEQSKKKAISMFVKAIELTKSTELMDELATMFETGTPLMEPCERCALKWRRRALGA